MSKERVERESSDSLSSERSRKAAPTEARAGSRLGVFAGRASSGRFGAGQQGPPGGGDQGRFDGDQPEAVAASALAFQAKLAVGGSEDPAEREADAVAAEVVSRIARRDFSEDPEEVNRSPAERIRRRATVGSQGGPVDTDTEQRIQARRGNGRALPPDVAEQMGAGFGADFSDVRLHTGAESAELNSRLQARAFTVGNDIFLGNDTNIRSSEGQELLAHELTHTIQQAANSDVARRDGDAQDQSGAAEVTPAGPLDVVAAAASEGGAGWAKLMDRLKEDEFRELNDPAFIKLCAHVVLQSKQEFDNQEKKDANQAMVDWARAKGALKVVAPDSQTFYTGLKTEASASDAGGSIDQRTPGQSLEEGTKLGKLWDKLSFAADRWWDRLGDLWQQISEGFANEAIGEVNTHVKVGILEPSIFITHEFPALMRGQQRGQVGNIIANVYYKRGPDGPNVEWKKHHQVKNGAIDALPRIKRTTGDNQMYPDNGYPPREQEGSEW